MLLYPLIYTGLRSNLGGISVFTIRVQTCTGMCGRTGWRREGPAGKALKGKGSGVL